MSQSTTCAEAPGQLAGPGQARERLDFYLVDHKYLTGRACQEAQISDAEGNIIAVDGWVVRPLCPSLLKLPRRGSRRIVVF